MNKPVLLSMVVVIVAGASFMLWLPAGECHASLDALKASAAREGWLFSGRHGESWPACEQRREEANDGIVFLGVDGIEQQYEGFVGYRMQARFLRSNNGEDVIVVLRSKQRRADRRDENENIELEPRVR